MSYPPPAWPTIRWSASSLNQILRGCSAQFAYQRLLAQDPDRVAATMKLGSAVHAAHEIARVAQQEGREVGLDELLQAFEESWSESCADERLQFPKGKDAESLAEQGRKLVELLAENLGTEKVLAAEMPFEVEVDLPNGERRLLTGFFDAVLVNDDGRVTVFELKTSATAYNDHKLEDDVQAAAYAFAAREIYGPDVRLVYGVLIKNKAPRYQAIEVYKDATDFARLAKLIQVAESMIEAGIFYPAPDWRCGGCGYRAACSRWGTRLPLARASA